MCLHHKPCSRALTHYHRGTRFDVFGYLEERKQERRELQEFETLLDTIAAEVTSDNYRVALKLANLPQDVRGFGHIKSRNLALVTNRQQKLLREFRGELVPLATAVEIAA